MTESLDSSGVSFLDYLAEVDAHGDVGSDDIVGLVAPLMEQVVATHSQGQVAPLNGVDALRVSLGHLWYANADAIDPEANLAIVRGLAERSSGRGLQVTRRITIDDTVSSAPQDDRVANRDDAPRKAYFPDYVAWELLFDHHDALTDTFVLGLVMGSLVTGLDLTDPDDLQTFVAARHNLCALNSRLSPVIAQLIERMTHLERSERPQDLATVAEILVQYRYQELEEDIELELPSSDDQSRRRILLERLRSRLFEVSRRNRLLYFRETGGNANLTEGSVPHVMDVESISPKQLLFANPEFCRSLGSEKTIRLNRWLRFEDYPFLAPSLDRIRLQANRDAREYGFSQLRLVTAFLRWHNLKEAPDERINSPLILIPAKLVKRKGVRDHFELSVQAHEAEINPALRHYLNELYGIRLPETIDASDFKQLEALSDALKKQLAQSDNSVELELVTLPRIQLIKRKVTRRLDRYRRRSRATGRGLRSYAGLNYSYSGRRYEPLGVQIFARDVRPANAPSRELVENDERPRIIERITPDAASRAVERDFYSLDKGEQKGPNQWEIDLCAVTLANFSYRKMTLVRDYTNMIERADADNANFERLFSESTRPVFEPLELPPVAERYNVLPADPSQQAAVLRAREEDSYVIQGPPGTGKSQTITNLIVDYVARGKSVLFVCEKRVALDVVFHRLQQVGLGEACCLIHDVREDKKPFIMALKDRYEQALGKTPSEDLEQRRKDWLADYTKVSRMLEKFSAAMIESGEHEEIPLRQVIGRWIEGGAQRSPLNRRESSRLPDWEAFAEVGEATGALREALSRGGYDGVLARSPVRYLRSDICGREDYLDFIEDSARRSLEALVEAEPVLLAVSEITNRGGLGWGDIRQVVDMTRQMSSLAEAEKLDALDIDSPLTARLQKLFKTLDERENALELAGKEAAGWRLSEPVEDLGDLVATARRKQGTFLAFLSSGWRQAKRLVREHYSGAESVADALRLLEVRQDTQHALEVVATDVREQLGMQDFETSRALLTDTWEKGARLPALKRDLVKVAVTEPDAGRMILKLVRLTGQLRRADDEITNLLCEYDDEPAESLQVMLQALADNAEHCDEFAEQLGVLDSLDPAAARALRRNDLKFEDLELAVLDETIHRRLRSTRGILRFDAAKLEDLVASLRDIFDRGRLINSEFALDICASNFHANLLRANKSMAKTTQEEKDWRRGYTRGRKILEREFEKTRAYRSVRDLFSAESGAVLRDLRPVWLMSPLSVADALPLDESLFDVVIFDEASQIPLEDAIPTVNRSRQMIVVGDEMQLPPTTFFAGRASGEDDEDESGLPDVVQYDLNADSFLNRADAALPGTLLNWHYRSKHESLIGFCNRAFYAGELKTIPTPGVLQRRAPIVVDDLENIEVEGSQVLEQPITFHRLANSPYDSQRNPGEATYIAHLVRAILNERAEATIGIVAFSQAQQNEIELALTNLAAEDGAFASRLEAEENREEEGQFVGLFVKNLENVQGDERDIIILSICYGPNHEGRMRMNFGPINQNGGHKRLNVIFSRAKRHMVVVSSIGAAQITNTYNEGANALRQYLRYAEAASIGDREGMAAALGEYGQPPQGLDTSSSARALQSQIRQALEERGYEVEADYGQSELRCHLAVRRAGRVDFELAILIDDRTHYAETDLQTRYTTNSGILRAFGWKVVTVLGKDWYQAKDKVIGQLTDAIESSGS